MPFAVRVLALASCAAVLAAGCKRKEPERPAAPAVQAESPPTEARDGARVLAMLPDGSLAADSANPGRTPQPAPSGPVFIFGEGGGVAWSDERDGQVRVYHQGRPGKAYAAVGQIALSPDGRRCAYGALVDGRWRMVVDGQEGKPYSAVKEPVFSPDGAHLAYQAMAGDRWYLVIDGKENGGTSARYGAHAFSGDSSRIAVLEDETGEGRGPLVVNDLAFQRPVVVARQASSFVLNPDRTRLAAVEFGDEGQQAVTASFAAPGEVSVGPPFTNVFGLAFGADGKALTYRGVRGYEAVVVLDGKETPQPFEDVRDQSVPPGGGRVGALVHQQGVYRFHVFFGGADQEERRYDDAEGLTYSPDGTMHAYAARRGERWFVVVNGKEGPPFDRVVTPRFSPDGRRLVYRARQDGRRFVVMADTAAKTVREHPRYEQVFPLAFTSDGRSVAYGVKDGRQLAWKVEAL